MPSRPGPGRAPATGGVAPAQPGTNEACIDVRKRFAGWCGGPDKAIKADSRTCQTGMCTASRVLSAEGGSSRSSTLGVVDQGHGVTRPKHSASTGPGPKRLPGAPTVAVAALLVALVCTLGLAADLTPRTSSDRYITSMPSVDPRRAATEMSHETPVIFRARPAPRPRAKPVSRPLHIHHGSRAREGRGDAPRRKTLGSHADRRSHSHPGHTRPARKSSSMRRHKPVPHPRHKPVPHSRQLPNAPKPPDTPKPPHPPKAHDPAPKPPPVHKPHKHPKHANPRPGPKTPDPRPGPGPGHARPATPRGLAAARLWSPPHHRLHVYPPSGYQARRHLTSPG